MSVIPKVMFSNDLNDLPKLPVGTNDVITLPGFARTKYGENFSSEKAAKSIYYNEDREGYESFTNALISDTERFAESLGYKVFIDVNLNGDVMVENLGFSFGRLVTGKLKELMSIIEDEDDEEEHVVFIRSKGRHKTERTTIYNYALKRGLKVSPTMNGNDWEVRPAVKKTINNHLTKTKGDINIMGKVDLWLDTLDFETPTVPPYELTSVCTESYFRTVLNKSTYLLSYRKGFVIRHRFVIRKYGSKYRVVLPTGVIGESEKYDIKLFNLWLKPHGYEIKE